MDYIGRYTGQIPSQGSPNTIHFHGSFLTCAAKISGNWHSYSPFYLTGARRFSRCGHQHYYNMHSPCTILKKNHTNSRWSAVVTWCHVVLLMLMLIWKMQVNSSRWHVHLLCAILITIWWIKREWKQGGSAFQWTFSCCCWRGRGEEKMKRKVLFLPIVVS
jgi:hypothetical protein